MSDQPRFSIITCTRNSIGTLADTLRSVQSQQGVQVEHIFVDGDSTDGTLELLQQLSGNTRLLTGVRGGIARAMNAGIQAATGEFVAHLHSDDYYLHSDVLARASARLQADSADWLFGRIAYLEGDSLQPEPFATPVVTPDKLLRRNYIPHPATFVRRAVFDTFGGFREDYRLAMDYEFWLRIAPHTRYLQLNDVFTAFRVHPGSATEKFAKASFHEDFRARFAHGAVNLWPEFAARYLVRRVKMALAAGA